MENQISTLWSLSNREKGKAILLTILGAFVALLWTGLDPVIATFVKSQVIDFTPFFAAVNWSTVMNTALTAGGLYTGVTAASGPKK
jgi:hypothetical protein